MRKKLLTTIIIGSMVVALSGCGNSSESVNADDTNKANTESTNDKSDINDATKNKETDNKEQQSKNNVNNENTKEQLKNNNNDTNNKSENTTYKKSDENQSKSNVNNNDNRKKENSSNIIHQSENKENESNNKENTTKSKSNNIENSSLSLSELAQKVAEYEIKSKDVGAIIPVNVSREGNNLSFEKDPSSNIFLNTNEKFSKNVKDGILIVISADEEKDGEKTYHSFKLLNIKYIEDGGSGTIDFGRIYNDGSIKIGNF